MKEKDPKKKDLHLTRPPRMEGKVRNAMMNTVLKKKREKTLGV